MSSRACTETACRQELDRALRRLRRGDDPASVLETLSRRLTNKLIHRATKAICELGHQHRRARQSSLP